MVKILEVKVELRLGVDDMLKVPYVRWGSLSAKISRIAVEGPPSFISLNSYFLESTSPVLRSRALYMTP
jgi:hypothetical protein